jgi:hypothetical protein
MQGIASRGQRTFRSKFVSRWWQCICKSNVQKQAMQRTLTLTVKLTLLKRNVNGQTLASTTALCSGVPLVANLRRTRQRSIRSEAALPETKYKDQMFRPEPSCIIRYQTTRTKLHCQFDWNKLSDIIRDQVHGPSVSRGRSKVRWKRTACLERWSARPPRPRSTRARPLVYTRDRRTDLRDGRRRKQSFSGRCFKCVVVLLGGDARYIFIFTSL